MKKAQTIAGDLPLTLPAISHQALEQGMSYRLVQRGGAVQAMKASFRWFFPCDPGQDLVDEDDADEEIVE